MNKLKLLSTYKAIPLKQRLSMALSIDVKQDYRQFLAVDQWSVIRCYFSRREDLSTSEVQTLINDDDYVTRLSIAKRQDLTLAQVAQCVSDFDPNVRHAISRNSLISDEQRQLLLNDDDALVVKAASKGPRKIQYRQRKDQARLIK